MFSFCSFIHMVVCIFSICRPSVEYLEIVWAGPIFARYIRQLAVCLITMWILWPYICCFSGFTSAFIMFVCKYTKGTLFHYIMMQPLVYLTPAVNENKQKVCNNKRNMTFIGNQWMQKHRLSSGPVGCVSVCPSCTLSLVLIVHTRFCTFCDMTWGQKNKAVDSKSNTNNPQNSPIYLSTTEVTQYEIYK